MVLCAATGNAGKLRELRRILEAQGHTVKSQKELGITLEPEETGNTSMTFEEWYDKFVNADYLFYYNLGQKFYSVQEMIDYNPLFADFKAVQNGNVWVTCDGFSQKSADIVGVITDMNTVLTSEDNTVSTDFIVKIS